MLDCVGHHSFPDLAELERFEGDQQCLDGVLDDAEVSVREMLAYLGYCLKGPCLATQSIEQARSRYQFFFLDWGL